MRADVGFCFEYGTSHFGIVDSLLEDLDDGPCAVCARIQFQLSRETPMPAERNLSVPVFLYGGDVLPSLAPGDDVALSATCVSRSMLFYEGPAGEADAGARSPSSVPGRGMAGAFSDAGGGLVSFAAGSEEGFFEEVLDVPFCSAKEMLRVWVKTPYGSLELVRAADGLSERQRSLVRPGCCVKAEGWLVADVAFGDYDYGPRSPSAWRLHLPEAQRPFMAVLSEDCRLYSQTGISAKGRDAVAHALDDVENSLREAGLELLAVACGVLRFLEEDIETHHVDGEKCLAFLTPDYEMHSLLFAETDGIGMLCRIVIEQDFSDDIGVSWTGIWEDWHRGLMPEPDRIWSAPILRRDRLAWQVAPSKRMPKMAARKAFPTNMPGWQARCSATGQASRAGPSSALTGSGAFWCRTSATGLVASWLMP
ncbi:MAG: hypothetical protein IIZ02_04690 [Desulfovibrio sp.]|nr:hypothetical protein [Desulfovibrio sp.]